MIVISELGENICETDIDLMNQFWKIAEMLGIKAYVLPEKEYDDAESQAKIHSEGMEMAHDQIAFIGKPLSYQLQALGPVDASGELLVHDDVYRNLTDNQKGKLVRAFAIQVMQSLIDGGLKIEAGSRETGLSANEALTECAWAVHDRASWITKH